MQLVNNFKALKILVAGDLMLDRYWWGTVTRISPEAPVPVVRVSEFSDVPGGAANVARNVAGLGATPILLGGIGNDEEGQTLKEALLHSGIDTTNIQSIDGWETVVKTRIIAHGQHVARVDRESSKQLSTEDESALLQRISELLPTTDAVLISDYAKGFLSHAVVRSLIDSAIKLEKPVVVDPKGRDFLKYQGATLITPNKREAGEACGLDIDTPDLIEIAGLRIMQHAAIESVLITRSDEGMTLFSNGRREDLAAEAVEIYDVTGAGDTVLACLGVGIAAGLPITRAARLANIAAGIVVGQVGTSSITAEDITSRLGPEWDTAG